MQITQNMKMADVIQLNYLLLPVINRFGIQLGFGDVTVNEICLKKEININFFLDIVNSYHDKNFFPAADLQSFSVELIIDYLRKAHTNYLEDSIPHIEELINILIKDSTFQKQNLQLLKNFFNEYKKEITDHINREEKEVYPYALYIEEAFENLNINADIIDKMKTYSINNYINEHDNIEEKLYDLKNIIIKYLPPPKNNDLCNRILTKLFNLEKDLNDHSRIEEKVMVPKIKKMEEKLLSRYTRK